MKSKPKFASMQESLDSNQKKIKLLMIGDSGVGKTALVCRYVRNQFHETFINTLGIDFQQRQAKVEGKSVHIQIWDTAGQERFHTITKAYYRGTEGIIIAFSLNSLQTFRQLEYWINQIEEEASSNCAKLLVGTKSDLKENAEVSENEITKFAERYGLKYIETSAKLNHNVEFAFEVISKEVFARSKKDNDLKKPIPMRLSAGQLAEGEKKVSKRSRC